MTTRKHFTRKEEKYIMDHYPTAPIEQMEAHLKRPAISIRQKAHHMGIANRKRGRQKNSETSQKITPLMQEHVADLLKENDRLKLENERQEVMILSLIKIIELIDKHK